MWIDEAGGAHTAALPEPRRWVDPALLEYLKKNRPDDPLEEIEDLEDEIINASLATLGQPYGTEGSALPNNVVLGRGGAFDTRSFTEVIESVLDAIPLEWRLDGLMVIIDICAELDEDE